MIIIIVCLLFALCLAVGLLSVLRNLMEHNSQEAPVFHDLGPNFPDPVAEYREPRSQFAWQSRSHSRGPD
jgi:hypothetical protein